jgi:Domain of unknown function (DUF4383)
MADDYGRTDRSERTPAQVYSLVFGVTLLVAGIAGFFADSSFGDLGSNVQGDDLIVFEVNGWHNLIHIASGVLGLALMGTAAGARLYALGFGTVYLLVTIWGFIDGNDVLGLFPVNTADNWLHVAIAVTGIIAGLASDPRRHTRAATDTRTV